MSEARQGGCRCGRVRFEVSGEPIFTSACHCTGCQRMTASAFSLSEGYPAAAFRTVSGETVIGGLHGASRHHHCGHCLSWLYTQPEGLDDFVNVRATMFDEPRTAKPFVEVFVGEALPWAPIGAARSYDQLPKMEDWPQIFADYVRNRATEGSYA